MSARRPTLEEWFLAFQLRRMQRENAYATGSLTVEVTALVNDHAARAADALECLADQILP